MKPVEEPDTIATAIRIEIPSTAKAIAARQAAMSFLDVTDEEIIEA